MRSRCGIAVVHCLPWAVWGGRWRQGTRGCDIDRWVMIAERTEAEPELSLIAKHIVLSTLLVGAQSKLGTGTTAIAGKAPTPSHSCVPALRYPGNISQIEWMYRLSATLGWPADRLPLPAASRLMFTLDVGSKPD